MIEAMKKALEALDLALLDEPYFVKAGIAMVALRQAIEQAEKWDTSDMSHRAGGLTVDVTDLIQRAKAEEREAIKRPWVGLTDEESEDIYNAHHNTYGECITSAYDLVLDVEAKLRERNT